jgi:hypothetical protein
LPRPIAALVPASLLFLLVANLPLTAQTVFEPPQAVPVIGVPPVELGKTDVLGAIGDSMKLLVTEHVIRIAFQAKTREELGGPFWSDYRRSIRRPAQWEDSDSWAVNYVGHPIHGAAAGIIWLDHGPHRDEPVSLRGSYLGSRARAAAFSAVYSLQFELGPVSEASIGNVGMRPETTGWVDHVVTPVGALGMMIAGDAIDRYFITWVERRVNNRVARAAMRMVFNPSRTLANLAQNHEPWRRPNRSIGWK